MKLIILCTQKSEEQCDPQKLLGAFKTELEARETANYLAGNNPGQVSGQPQLNHNQPLTASALYTTDKGAPKVCILQTESQKQQMLGSDKCCREEGNFKKTWEMFSMLVCWALGSTLPLKNEVFSLFQESRPKHL